MNVKELHILAFMPPPHEIESGGCALGTKWPVTACTFPALMALACVIRPGEGFFILAALILILP